MTQVLLATVIGGTALVGVVYALFPARPSLAAAIARSQGTLSRSIRPKVSDGFGAWRSHIGRNVASALASRTSVLEKISPDLAIASTSAEEIAFTSLLGAIAGLAVGPVIAMAASVAGIGVSLVFPCLVSLALGFGGASLSYFELKSQAAKAREHFVAVVASYLEWVSMCQAGGMGIEESLVTSASICDDWALSKIRSELAHGSLRSRTPWDSLGALGARIAVTDLQRLRRTVRLAGTEGARVRDSISALALAIRDREMDAARKGANKVSRRVFLANVVLMTGFIALVIYPGIVGHF